MIEYRPNVGWIGDHSSGGLTVYPVDEDGYSLPGEGIELGHGIPTDRAMELGRELERVLDEIIEAQRRY